MKVTPQNIEELKPNEVFVFGSNMNGNHAGGAAKTAKEKFGAIDGQSEGMQGQSYAIPTLDKKMKKLSLEAISESVDKLYHFADDNADIYFYVTKIGCGIAGFKEDEIANIFKSKETPLNVILPVEFLLIKGFKGFDKGLKCRNFQYEENKEYKHYGPVEACRSGFHFCTEPFDVFNHYKGMDKDFSLVEGQGSFSFDDSDSKVAVSNIKIKTKLSFLEFVKVGVEYTQKKVSFLRKQAEKNIEKNKNDSSVNSGLDYSVNSGLDYSVNSGRNYSVNSGRNYSVNSGLDYSVNSGLDSSVCAGRHNSEIRLEGVNSFGIAGKNSKIKAKKGCAICLVEFDNNGDIIDVKSAIIDGKKLKEDTFYSLKDGEFVETK